MSDDRKPGYDAVIPARVRYDPELTDKAKLLYGEIRALASREGYCWAHDKTLASYYGVSASCISDNLRLLESRGHIFREVLRDEETKEVLERRIWIDRARFLSRDPDLPPPDFRGTPPPDFRGTPPPDFRGENITRVNSTSKEDPPVAPPAGGTVSRRRKKEPLPDWEPDRFEKFWQLYPKTRSNANQKKADARRAWNQLRPDEELIAYMGKVLRLQMETDQWKEGVGVPYAATWVRAFGKDELPDLETLTALAASADAPAGGWAEDPEVM